MQLYNLYSLRIPRIIGIGIAIINRLTTFLGL